MPRARPTETTSIADASMRMKCGYNRTLNRVLRGELEGYQDESGHWHVSVDSINAWLARRAAADAEPRAAA